MSQPIEPLIRAESPPDAPVLVLRGGPLTAEKIVEHASRQQAVFTYRGAPMIAISVDPAIEGWTLGRSCEAAPYSWSSWCAGSGSATVK